MVKVEFLKDSCYRWKYYKKGSIINMSKMDVNAYIECKVVKMIIPVKKKPKTLEDMSYREIQQQCKKNRIQAVGPRENLIASLKMVFGKDVDKGSVYQ